MKPFTISKSGRTIQAGSFTIKIESGPCAASAAVEKQIEEHRRLLVQILAASPLMYKALSRIYDNITRWLATEQPAGPEESRAIYEEIAAALQAAGNPTDLLQRINEYAERQCEQTPKRLPIDRPWRDYPIGTKAHAFNGGYWTRVRNGWKWFNGSTFPTPGADAIGECIELPIRDVSEAEETPQSIPPQPPTRTGPNR